ncbi:hypothetical protein LJC55_02495 [Eubacteriales bacterium OttesenSCG-928-N14]|nr:hypothetical protein [Eubacteriales bacterium OttesenSCG-928-N14]
MKTNRLLLWICVFAMLVVPLSGCNGNSTASTKELTVQVQNVNGSEITAAIGTMPQMDMNNLPSMPTDGSALPNASDRPDMPDGSNFQGGEPPSSTFDSGKLPDGFQGNIPGGMGQFEESGETVTFTVTDSTTITVSSIQGEDTGSMEDIVVGAILTVELDGNNTATKISITLRMVGNISGDGIVNNGTSANTISADGSYTDKTYVSSGDNENALCIDDAVVTLSNATVSKAGGASTNSEDGDFYGQNAALLALNGAMVNINNTSVDSNATNGNGVFSYGQGTVINISDSTIRTKLNNSGGIHVTGGGTLNATNLDVETQGNSAAAIRSDRGGGTITATGGSYTTNGTGSPAIYSTADVTVNNATLTANASEAVVVEGNNSVTLKNCTVVGNMSGTYGAQSSEHIHNIMIYQSMSGDADIGNAVFSATGGSITARSGDLFYVTNTSCSITLNDVSLTLANGVFLTVSGNDASRGWGSAGTNGGTVDLTALAQQLQGKIVVDNISSLDMKLQNGTSFTGSINESGQSGNVNVTLDGSSTWTLTADSYISAFDGKLENVVANGYTLYVNGSAVN